MMGKVRPYPLYVSALAALEVTAMPADDTRLDVAYIVTNKSSVEVLAWASLEGRAVTARFQDKAGLVEREVCDGCAADFSTRSYGSPRQAGCSIVPNAISFGMRRLAASNGA